MLFENTWKTFQENRRLKNAERLRIRKQQKELGDLLPFEAEIGIVIQLAEMINTLDPEVDSINCKSDDKSTSLVTEYTQTLLEDFTVNQNEDDPSIFNLKIKEV